MPTVHSMTVALDPVSRWRIEQFKKIEGIDTLSGAVRDLVQRGWNAHMHATDRATSNAARHAN